MPRSPINRIALYTVFIASIAVLAGCPNTVEHYTVRYAYAKSIFVDGASVYVVGNLEGNNDDYQMNWNYEARLWKDGVPTKLQSPAGGYSEHAFTVGVYGGHVYVGGYYANAQWQGTACYWVDGVAVDLPTPSGASNQSAYSLAVLGGTVYAAGSYHGDSNLVACYWAGTTEIDLPLPPGALYSDALSVCVAGSDIVIAGWYIDANGHSIACYWTAPNGANPVRTDLEMNAKAMAVFYDGTGLYFAGTYKPAGGGTIACYWTNGVKNDLSVLGDYVPEVTGLFVSGGKVYVSGWYGGVCYWIDDGATITRIDLNPSGTDEATGIFVTGGSVYVSGTCRLMPCYWTCVGATAVKTELQASF